MSTTEVRTVLEAFIDDLYNRLSTTHAFEAVLAGEKTDLDSRDLGMKPEEYTENHLVQPLLDTVGLEYDPQMYGQAGDQAVWPDLGLTNIENNVIGENKKLNTVEAGVSQLKDYLDRKSIGAEYGILTDGIEWRVYKIELGGDFTEYPQVTDPVDLRPALQAVAREAGYLSQSAPDELDVDAALDTFVGLFERESFNQLLSQEAPRRLRDERKRDVEAFYELYIEYLFGESEQYDYETSLLDDIRSPSDASDRDERLFAITLMNRLLFIKFLETREILSEGFLRERVEHYQNTEMPLAGNLYESQIRPLFYKLFNTPEDERDPKHHTGWFAEVPYLNGGLFRENIENEGQYTVIDRTLPDVIADLIEGSELDLNGRGFDPALIGSVFEKTINHIEQERTQKDIGAYYTPNDVTDIVVRQSVDPKIQDVLVDAFALEVASDDDQEEIIRSTIEGMELSEILRAVENGEGYFGTPAAVKMAHDRLSELRVLDPACGSGHFLTAAMDEIHRAQVSLLRGLNRGDAPDPEDRYAAKKNLALNAIYGVDVDRIATEIGKLRVWLKIVEGNGWQPSFGRLPNIDVNIVAGNSLVGLPMKGTIESLDIWDERVAEVAERRHQYKFEDEGERREIETLLEEEIRPELDQEFLKRFNSALETEITDVDEFDAVMESIEQMGKTTLYPTIESIQVKRVDRNALTDEETTMLEERGFNTYTKSARLDVEARESALKNGGIESVRTTFAGELRELLDEDYEFTEVKRRPLPYDLGRILGEPFHWIVEFPEVTEEDGNTHSINFDLILGNPPYGDLLNEAEDLFVSTFETANIGDISAQFVERELQLLAEDGYFGNVTTLRLVYQSTLYNLHELIRSQLDTTHIACFAKRPSHIFDNAQVRAAIITGKKTDGEGEIKTSEFIRFDRQDREQRLSNLSYEPVSGYLLGDKIGTGNERYSILPKIGNNTIKSILERLKESSDTVFEDRCSRQDETPFEVWRMRHPDNWVNPMLREMYDAQDLEPMFFETELERDSVFLIMSSSLFYCYWMVYGNQRDLNWGQVEAFPFPPSDAISARESEISDLADRLWNGMEEEFTTDPNPHYKNMSSLKLLINAADELFGEIYGLTPEQIEYVQKYDSAYGRSGPTNEQLPEAR